jgi:hypothetical protein
MWRDYSVADEDFDIHELIPPFGLEEVPDRVGMEIMIVTLKASLLPGLYTRHLQYKMMHKTATWSANLYSTGSAYDVDTLYAKDQKKLHVTICASQQGSGTAIFAREPDSGWEKLSDKMKCYLCE